MNSSEGIRGIKSDRFGVPDGKGGHMYTVREVGAKGLVDGADLGGRLTRGQTIDVDVDVG